MRQRSFTPAVVGCAALFACTGLAVGQDGSSEALPEGVQEESAEVPESEPSDPAVSALDAEAPAVEEEGGGGLPEIDGSFLLRYRGRRTTDEADHDLLSLLRFDVGRESDEFRLHGVVRSWADLDGRELGEFAEASDAIGAARRIQLEEGYLDWSPDVDGLRTVRLGRQPLVETPRFLFLDGASIETDDLDLPVSRAGAYGGSSRHLFESSPEGDALYGAFLESRPSDETRLRVDWMHVSDHSVLGHFDDDLFRGQAWWRPVSTVRTHGSGSVLDGDLRDLSFDATLAPERGDLVARVRWYGLLKTQRTYGEELDPYFLQTFEERPYHEVDLVLGKGFGDGWFLNLHGRARRLSDDADEGTFNREFTNAGVSLSAEDHFAEDLDVEVFLDSWNSTESRILALGGGVEQEWEEVWKLGLGSDYALYRQDPFRGTERQRVRRYFARVQREVSTDLHLDLRYDLAHDDEETTHTWIASCTWNF